MMRDSAAGKIFRLRLVVDRCAPTDAASRGGGGE
jgi:hypothetical protein